MSTQTKRLYRSRKNRMLFGVAAGLGEYFGLDPTLVRLFFVFGLFFLGVPGTLALAYLILAIVVPEDPSI
jgi:phage shock protein C